MQSILDGSWLTTQQKTDVQNGTQTGDLTTGIHNALNSIQAAGGGTLYFPQGLYPCNIVLGGTTGRTRVHLLGEGRGAARLKSFTTGGFAVQDINESGQGYAPPDIQRRLISDITFLGESKTRCGLLIASKAGTETANLTFFECLIGMMVCDTYYGTHLRPVFRSCDVGAWFGTISGTITTPNVTLPAFLAAGFATGQASPATLIGSYFYTNRIGLLAFGGEDSPILHLVGGAFEGNHVPVFVPMRATPTQLAQQFRRHWSSISLDSMWIEANGEFYAGVGSETVNGWVARRADLHVGQGVVRLNNIWTEQIKVEGTGQIYGDNMVYARSGNPVFYDIPEPSRVIYDRADGVGDVIYGPLVKRPIPSEAPSCSAALIPPKRAFGHHRAVLLADSCTGTQLSAGLEMYGGDVFATYGVQDGLLAPRCISVEIPAAGNRGWVLTPPGGIVLGKAYVLTGICKPLSIAMNWTFAATTSLQGSKLLPPDVWSTFALVGVAATNESSLLFLFVNSTGSTQNARFGGIALLEFNNKDEAAEACASDIFPLRVLPPPQSRILAPISVDKIEQVAVLETEIGVGTAGQGVAVTLPVPIIGIRQNDIVVVLLACDSAVTEPVVTTAGYSTIATWTTEHGVLTYKRMGASPDSTVTITRAGPDLGNIVGVIIQILRGVNITQAIDATGTPVEGATGMPAPPTVTTTTANTRVVVYGALDDDKVAASVTAPAGYSDLIAHETSPPAGSAGTLMAAAKTVPVSGVETPAAFGGTGDDANWALTVAWRNLQASEPGAPDLAHAINTNLAFFVGSHPTGSALLGKELISNTSFSFVGSAAFTGDHPAIAGWKCLKTFSATADAAYLGTTPAGLTGLSTVYTMWADIQIDTALVDGVASTVLSTPLNTGWTANFAKLMWAKSNTTNKAFAFMRNVGVNNNSAASGAASFPTTGRYRVAVVRNGTNYEFYLNGAQAGTDETGAATAIDWTGTDRGVTLLNRHNGDPGEGMIARLLGLRVWSRALSGAEISALNTDPQLGTQ